MFSLPTHTQPSWDSRLDSDIRFYQSTDFGIILAGTEKSLYAIDGETGERIWRRSTGKVNETGVTPIPDTDLILLSRDLGQKSRLEAVDLFSGSSLWESDKIKGDVLQLAVDPESDLAAVVVVKDPRGRNSDDFRRTPIIHVLKLSSGKELWKRELDSDIRMMPARFGDDLGEIAYTLDNYRAPLLLDGRLYLFYDGATSYDARTGKEKEREKFTVNEDGLALTEADPVFNNTHIFISGRGKIRAVNRRTGDVDWKANDLGNAAEMALIDETLFVRTGGQFTRLRDGEISAKGPYGVAAIDTQTGDELWRFKGADKGLTNFVFADRNTILIADRDDLISIDTRSGKRTSKFEHNIDRAQFVLINERGDTVVGGRDEIAAFAGESERWRVRHKAPSRGALRTVAGIAFRATALYFRYGGMVASSVGFIRGGLGAVSAVNSFRWSGLLTRFGSFGLTTLASNYAKNQVTRRIYAYGTISRIYRAANLANRINGLQVRRPGIDILGAITPTRADFQESILDRLDPARYAEKISNYLMRRKRLAELRGNHMYYFTELAKPFDRKGLVGVNIHNGRDERFVLASDPDPRFVTDEIIGNLYTAEGNRLRAFDFLQR